ncbi:FCS-Like Zinc finger 17-like isoform X2 [Apium graveolens]
MSVKRSRLGESSNFIEKDLLNHMSFTVESARGKGIAAPSSGERKPPKCFRPSVDEGNKEQLRQNVILKSPSQASKSGGLGDFLKYCNFCSKTIPENKDVFMYRDYCAYCSEQCRDFQIEIDEMFQKQLEDSRAAVQDQEVKNVTKRFF